MSWLSPICRCGNEEKDKDGNSKAFGSAFGHSSLCSECIEDKKEFSMKLRNDIVRDLLDFKMDLNEITLRTKRNQYSSHDYSDFLVLIGYDPDEAIDLTKRRILDERPS